MSSLISVTVNTGS